MSTPRMHQSPRRKPAHPTPIRHADRPTILMVTVTLSSRYSLLDNPAVHDASRMSWTDATAWNVGYYMIMPDHYHLFCSPGNSCTVSVTAWCGYWKRSISKRVPSISGQWQQDIWDLQIRTALMYQQKLEYVMHNPVRAGLAADANDWPFQGVMSDLQWTP